MKVETIRKNMHCIIRSPPDRLAAGRSGGRLDGLNFRGGDGQFLFD